MIIVEHDINNQRHYDLNILVIAARIMSQIDIASVSMDATELAHVSSQLGWYGINGGRSG